MARNRATTIPSPAIRQSSKKSATGKRQSKPKGHTGGRPSREAAIRLGERILDVATELFLRDGYGTTSIEMIARDARVSKRTLYQRFPDKAALFTNVVHRIVERLRPPNEESLFEGDDLEKILRRLAVLILNATLSPNALALHRIIIAEATRFPELAMVVSQGSAGAEAVRRIGARCLNVRLQRDDSLCVMLPLLLHNSFTWLSRYPNAARSAWGSQWAPQSVRSG